MARSKFQEGSMFIEGEGAKRKYVVRFRVYDADGEPIRKKVTLGLVSSLSKRDAKRMRTEVVAQHTAQLPKPGANKSEMTLEKFYTDRFLPLKTHWSEPMPRGSDTSWTISFCRSSVISYSLTSTG